MKRLVCELRWDKKRRAWLLLERGRRGSPLSRNRNKAEGDKWARWHCRTIWEEERIPVQLLIYNRDGKIARGNRSESTYGRDPRRSVG